jgi:hypothetical protein
MRCDRPNRLRAHPCFTSYLYLLGLHDVWKRQHPTKHFAPEFRVPKCQQWSRKLEGEYIQPDYKEKLFQLCEDMRVAQSDRLCRIAYAANLRSGKAGLTWKRLIGIWEQIKPALVSVLAEPIL